MIWGGTDERSAKGEGMKERCAYFELPTVFRRGEWMIVDLITVCYGRRGELCKKHSSYCTVYAHVSLQTVDISGGNTAGTTLSGLLPSTQYLFSLQASNNQGSSAWISPPLMVTLPG